jgi:CRP-like cAMP-binding protein
VIKETEATLSAGAQQVILNSIGRMKIFAGVHMAKLLRIVKLIKGTRVPEGRAIVTRGKPGEAFYIVLEGECEVMGVDENGHETVLAILPGGECFGEMSLITGEPASATVRAKNDVTILVISRENFNSMLSIAPEIAITLARILAARLANTGRRVIEELKKGLAGRLDLISPAELIQAMNVNSQTGMIAVQNGDKSMTIYLHDGQIHEVQMGDKSGEEVFFEFLSWSKGNFHFDPIRRSDSEKQVQMDTVGLLLEGMRRVDEFKQTGVWRKS